MGLAKSNGMGLTPVDWVDIKAFADLMGLEIWPEEAKLIRELSTTYVSVLSSSKDEGAACPGFRDETDDKASDSIRLGMQSIKEKANRKFSK